MPPRDVLTPDFLAAEYVSAGKSTLQIGREVGCNQQSVANALKRHGIPIRPPGPPSGERNPSWNGGMTVDKDGYMLIRRPDHPRANSNGYVREHRLEMEKALGRYLLPSEVVHHRGRRDQNTHPYLEVFAANADHLRRELKGRVPNWTPEGRQRMQEAAQRQADRQRGVPLSAECKAKMSEAHRRRHQERRRQHAAQQDAASRAARESDVSL